MRTIAMWMVASAFGFLGCSDSIGERQQGLSGELTGDELVTESCIPGTKLRDCPWAGPLAKTLPDPYSCTPENSLFGGWPTGAGIGPDGKYYDHGVPQPTTGLAEVVFYYLPLEFIRDDFVANGKYLTYDNSEIHSCTPPLQNNQGGQAYLLPPGRYRFGVTYQPQLTQELDLAADQTYEVRFAGHVGELKTTVSLRAK